MVGEAANGMVHCCSSVPASEDNREVNNVVLMEEA